VVHLLPTVWTIGRVLRQELAAARHREGEINLHVPSGRRSTANAFLSGNPYARSTLNVTRQAEIMKSDPERARALEAEAIQSGEHYSIRPAAAKR
jgi:hypothetical protein